MKDLFDETDLVTCHFCRRVRPYTDFAWMNDWPYCHGLMDNTPTCYTIRVWRAEGVRYFDEKIIALRRSEALDYSQ